MHSPLTLFYALYFQRLENINENMYYTRVRVEDVDDASHQFDMYMLQKRIIQSDRVVIIFRTISEDDAFPFELGAPLLEVAAWYIFMIYNILHSP